MIRKCSRKKFFFMPILAAALIAACSGTPDTPEALYNKMLGAYGGAENLGLLTSYSGKGFAKKLPVVQVAESYPFDISQSDLLIKSKLMNVEKGMLTGIRLVITDKESSYEWTNENGRNYLPSWEKVLLKYRFPYVLKWIGDSRSTGEIVPVEGESDLMALRYYAGTDIVTLGIDQDSWLLKEMYVRSTADSTFLFHEVYSDYRKIDGTWFPSRFTADYSRVPYYEYYLVKIELGSDLPESFFAVLPDDTTGIYRPSEEEEAAGE